MKKLILSLFLLGSVFAVSFMAARWEKKTEKVVSRFNPVPFALKNQPFTIVITGFNNGATIAKTLNSLFSQNYDNYRLIYIDDASTDGSFELARDLIYESNHLLQATIVHNEEKLGEAVNLFRAVQACQDGEVVVVLRGEDWLSHEWVLQRLNAYYADPNLWLACGQHRDFPSYQLGPDRQFKTSHLKSFHASLLKKIGEADLLVSGYMDPMLEIAQDHAYFIPEILSIHDEVYKCGE